MNFLQTLKNIHKKTDISWWQFWLLCLFFMSFSFGQLGRIELSSATIYFHDLVIFIWLMISVPDLFKSSAFQFNAITLKKWWLPISFLGWLLIGMVVAYIISSSLVPWLYLGRLFLYVLFIISLFSRLKSSPLVLRVLLISSGIYMIWFGLLQYFLIPDTRFLLAFGWDEHYYRLIGPLLDPNLTGILYLIIGWLLFSLRKTLPKNIWFGTLLMAGIAIVLTYSRATYLATVISIVFYLWRESKTIVISKKVVYIVTGVILAGALIYAVAPKPGGDGVNLLRTTSIIARINTTTSYFSSLKPYQWILGNGFYSPLSSTSESSHARVPDNLFVLLIVNTGIVGLALFLLTLKKYLPNILKWENETLAALVAVLLHAQINNSLLEPFVFLCLGIAIISQFRAKT